jgi:hypothetical protein
MTPQHRQLLDEQIPGWDETFRDAWERKAEEVAEFRLRPGELPPASSREPLVRSQARWLKDQRRGRGLTPKLEAFLDRVLPGCSRRTPIPLSSQVSPASATSARPHSWPTWARTAHGSRPQQPRWPRPVWHRSPAPPAGPGR